MRKSTVNAVELGTNTDRTKNIVLSVPNSPDGSFVISKGYLNDDGSVVGTAVLSGDTSGLVSLTNAPTPIAITLQNSWVNFGAPWGDAKYVKDQLGYVHLSGFIKNGTTATGTIIGNLPVGYRPSANINMVSISYGYPMWITIFTNGDIAINGTAVSNTWVSLDIAPFKPA